MRGMLTDPLTPPPLIPAKAGTQGERSHFGADCACLETLRSAGQSWVPAFAGMSGGG
jgi:hypothetical protein